MIMALSKKMKNRKGFTLIELIVVIAILAILAVIAIPRLAGFSENAKQSTDREAAAVVANAAAQYFALHQSDATPPSGSIAVATLVTAGLVNNEDTILHSEGYAADPDTSVVPDATISGNTVSVTLSALGHGATDYTVTK